MFVIRERLYAHPVCALVGVLIKLFYEMHGETMKMLHVTVFLLKLVTFWHLKQPTPIQNS